MKLYIEEPASASIQERIAEAVATVLSSIAYVEARAAFARRRRSGDIAPAEHRRIATAFDSDWQRYVRLEVTDLLLREAGVLTDRYPLRAYDAVHLASALAAHRRFAGDVVFACWDDVLCAAAIREGLQLMPR